MTVLDLAAGAFGAAGVISAAAWGLLRRRRAILAGQAAQALCFGAHFALVGAYTGFAMCGLSLVQLAMACVGRSPWSSAAFWATAPAISLLALATWDGWASAGAAIGLALATLGRWQRGMGWMRWFFVGSSLGWGSHNFLVASPFGLATDVLALATNAWQIWRDRRQLLERDRQLEFGDTQRDTRC